LEDGQFKEFRLMVVVDVKVKKDCREKTHKNSENESHTAYLRLGVNKSSGNRCSSKAQCEKREEPAGTNTLACSVGWKFE
jgi:hypothetical protein